MISNEKISVSMCVYGKDNPEHFKIAVDSILKALKEVTVGDEDQQD